MAVEVAVLLSAGRHPASLRSRAAAADARALELALRLGDGARIAALHAGDPAEPALRDYLGMGLDSLTVLRQPAGCDVLPALAAHLATRQPQLILAGVAAETGRGSGMLPYHLAQALGAALLANISELAIADTGVTALQALPRGRRRSLRAPLPTLATVSLAAPAPRSWAFARARRGRIEVIDVPPGPPAAEDVREQPARPKPRRLKLATAGSAADRLRAATEIQAGRGRLLVNPAPDEAAKAIYDYLLEEGILSPATLVPPGGRG
jgi:electron transfer flavoprotein beta subunit